MKSIFVCVFYILPKISAENAKKINASDLGSPSPLPLRGIYSAT